MSNNSKLWEDRLREFLDESRDSRVSRSTSKNPLHEVLKMCQDLGSDSHSYFKQVCLVGCVRAGVTRLEKNLVGVFDLK